MGAEADRWMLVSDVDGTLLGDEDELNRLLQDLAGEGVILVPNSSRPLASLRRSWDLVGVGGFAAQVGGLGTEVEVDGVITGWSERFESFDRPSIDRVLTEMGYHTNGDEFQTDFKASYSVPREHWVTAREAVDQVAQAQVVTSGSDDFDVIPIEAGKPAPLDYLAGAFGIKPQRVIGAGDSMNDLALLSATSHRIVVGNADPQLREFIGSRAIHSNGSFAAGVREGLRQLGVLR